jgi:hypothetical protein
MGCSSLIFAEWHLCLLAHVVKAPHLFPRGLFFDADLHRCQTY